MAKLMKLSTFAKTYFAEGEAPTKATLRKLIDSGDIAGARIGAIYYVDIQKLESTGNSLVDRVLLAS
jgi:hypothetical protein